LDKSFLNIEILASENFLYKKQIEETKQ